MGNKQSGSQQRIAHYGATGWGLIIYCGLAYMVTGSFWPATAANVVVPQVTARLGFADTSNVLFANSAVTFIAIAYTFVFTWLLSRFNTRVINFILLMITGVGVVLVGHVNTLPQYIAVWVFVIGSAMTLGQVALGALIGNYMPTKKGAALGWATIGSSVNTVVALPILNAILGAQGFTIAVLCFGLYLMLLGVLNLILWPSDPRKRGYEPDNGDISPEEIAAIEKAQSEQISNWTIGEILKNKNFWCIALGYGICVMIGAGSGGQLVVYLTDNGISQAMAITAMSVSGLLGIIGSLLTGYLDQIFSVRIAAMIMAVFFFISTFVAGFLPFSYVTMVLQIGFFGVMMGAGSNLPSSHGISCFGTDFTKAFRFVTPIIVACTACGSLVLGLSQRLTGSYKGTYKVLAIMCVVAFLLFFLSDSRMTKEPGQKPTAYKTSARREEKKKEAAQGE